MEKTDVIFRDALERMIRKKEQDWSNREMLIQEGTSADRKVRPDSEAQQEIRAETLKEAEKTIDAIMIDFYRPE